MLIPSSANLDSRKLQVVHGCFPTKPSFWMQWIRYELKKNVSWKHQLPPILELSIWTTLSQAIGSCGEAARLQVGLTAKILETSNFHPTWQAEHPKHSTIQFHSWDVYHGPDFRHTTSHNHLGILESHRLPPNVPSRS